MRLDPDDEDLFHLDLLHFYHDTREQFCALSERRPKWSDQSDEARAIRLALAECHGALRALSFVLTQQEDLRVGEFIVPFGSIDLHWN